MRLSDPALPAAQYLVGESALDVLRVPIEASGGVLESARPVQVQYRPGSDVVVRYSARVAWQGGEPQRETLVASTTLHGPHPGTVTLNATTSAGDLTVGVWRWPFDPVLVGLGDVVSAAGVASVLGLAEERLSIDIAAFRPTERAVIRVREDDRVVAYVKVVAPWHVAPIAERHAALRAGRVPAPEITATHPDRGLLVLHPLHGPTLRDLAKGAAGRWPEPWAFSRLAASLSRVDLPPPGPPSRLAHGPLHARMLGAVMPQHAAWFGELADRIGSFDPAPIDGSVHGDLHEGQVIVSDGEIVGLLDVDDAGPGASIDDRANLVARFRYRAITTPSDRRRFDDYADALRADALRADALRADTRESHDPRSLDVYTAAALAGLATGPFRIQEDGWQGTVAAVMRSVDDLSRPGR